MLDATKLYEKALRDARLNAAAEDGHSLAVEERDYVTLTRAKKAELARECLSAEIDVVPWPTDEEIKSMGTVFFAERQRGIGTKRALWQSCAPIGPQKKKEKVEALEVSGAALQAEAECQLAADSCEGIASSSMRRVVLDTATGKFEEIGSSPHIICHKAVPELGQKQLDEFGKISAISLAPINPTPPPPSLVQTHMDDHFVGVVAAPSHWRPLATTSAASGLVNRGPLVKAKSSLAAALGTLPVEAKAPSATTPERLPAKAKEASAAGCKGPSAVSGLPAQAKVSSVPMIVGAPAVAASSELHRGRGSKFNSDQKGLDCVAAFRGRVCASY